MEFQLQLSADFLHFPPPFQAQREGSLLCELKKNYFIEVQLIYNVVLISAVQKSDSVLYISISIY